MSCLLSIRNPNFLKDFLTNQVLFAVLCKKNTVGNWLKSCENYDLRISKIMCVVSSLEVQLCTRYFDLF